MKLEAKTILLPKEEREQLNEDIRLFGTGWVRITEGNIGMRLDPRCVQILPETK